MVAKQSVSVEGVVHMVHSCVTVVSGLLMTDFSVTHSQRWSGLYGIFTRSPKAPEFLRYIAALTLALKSLGFLFNENKYMIEIIFDKDLDKEVFCDFADFSIAGVDFGAKIKKDHPSITAENHKEYIDDFYRVNYELMESTIKELQEEIHSTQDEFFSAAANVFKKDYSEEKSIGALSIFDCNPRYPERSLFQVYFRRDLLGKVEVSYHETMHFLFFRFCHEECTDLIKDYDMNSGALWDLSEIFNVIVLNQPSFQNILKREELLFYPHLRDALVVAVRIWNEGNEDVKYLVENFLNFKK